MDVAEQVQPGWLVGGFPAATLTVSFAGASQNRLDPHSAQKPRRASLSLSGLAIQRNALL